MIDVAMFCTILISKMLFVTFLQKKVKERERKKEAEDNKFVCRE